MKTSSIELRASRGSALFSLASVNLRPARSNARSTIWRPRPPYCAFAASRVARRIAARARPVTTMLSQAAGGVRLVGARDQHLVAVAQRRDQRRDAAVDLGADGRIADVGVDGIGEVDRGRAARQRDQAPLGREAEHLVLEQFELGVLEELFRNRRSPAPRWSAAGRDRRGSRRRRSCPSAVTPSL